MERVIVTSLVTEEKKMNREEQIKEMFSFEKMDAAEVFTESVIVAVKAALKSEVPHVLIEGVLFKEAVNVHRTAEAEGMK